jgi:hypothetical protein
MTPPAHWPAPQAGQATLHEPARTLPVWGEFEVLVAGGGPAGLAAAVAAARSGARVLLVERYGFLGGMGTAAGVTNFCGLHANVHGEHRQVVQGVAAELLQRLQALGGLNAPHLVLGRILAQAYDTAAFKCAADAWLQAAGVQVLLHALVVAVSRPTPGQLAALVLETKSGRVAVRAQRFIDATGDADLCHLAGVPTETGDAEGRLLYPTLMFRVGQVDAERAGEAWRHIPQLMDEAQARGEFSFPRRGAIVRPQQHPHEWRVNVTQLKQADGRAVDGTDALALSAAEQDGRRQALDYLRFLRACVPGFEQAYLLDMPPQVGVRETRRLLAQHMLAEHEVLQCTDQPDSIGVNGWPLEQHVAGDVHWAWPAPGARGYNQLPYRMLVPRAAGQGGPDNLLVAGRCAGMTHAAQAAARVSGGCFVMGQAAGAAAALSLQQGTGVQAVPVAALQARLREQGAFLG